METGHSVVASLEHLRVGGELHGPAAGPAHSHSPHINQLGTHDTAHSMSKTSQETIQVYTVNINVRAHSVASLSHGHVGTH